ncbi:MAG: hypothetical protein WAK11_01710 [Candidatus Cybelea sp.]
MLRTERVVAAGATAVMLLLPSVVRADTTPVPTLVYNFTYSANQDINAKDSANPAEDYGAPSSGGGKSPSTGGSNAPSNPGSGTSHYQTGLNDKGTMTVAILGKQSDGGLIVSISEAGQQTRRAPAATCVVYGNTRVICDPNKTVYTEEYTLLRFLGQNFVDPANIDAKRHWQVVQDSPSMKVTADYVIGPTTSSDVQISETRKISTAGQSNVTTDVETKIGYDMSRVVPTTVAEYVTQRQDQGVSGMATTIYQTTLQLVSDTMAKT